MKIVSFLCVYNDHEFLDQAIEAFRHYPDKLYIIEGSWKASQKFGANSRSNNLVYDIINKYVDNKKVFLVQANENRERDQRQIGLELAKKDGADWCHMLDADEVYSNNSLLQIRKMLEHSMKSNVLGWRLKSYNFINSLKKWYNGDYMRIYRVTPAAQFVMDNDVVWPDKDGSVNKAQFFAFHHYNYVKLNSDAFWLKMNYQEEQDPSFRQRHLPHYGYIKEKKEYKIPSDIPIYDFTGKHPSIMKDHPYFKNDIFGDGELKYG